MNFNILKKNFLELIELEEQEGEEEEKELLKQNISYDLRKLEKEYQEKERDSQIWENNLYKVFKKIFKAIHNEELKEGEIHFYSRWEFIDNYLLEGLSEDAEYIFNSFWAILSEEWKQIYLNEQISHDLNCYTDNNIKFIIEIEEV